MSDTVSRQILLMENPAGKLEPEHFRMSEAKLPKPKDSAALIGLLAGENRGKRIVRV